MRKIQVVVPFFKKLELDHEEARTRPTLPQAHPHPFLHRQIRHVPSRRPRPRQRAAPRVIETIDEHCRARAGESGLNMLGNAMHASEIAYSLVEHVHTQLYGQKTEG